MLSSIAGHLAFAVGISMLTRIVYRLFGKPLNTDQMMATITAGWLILNLSNLSV